jgi:hypothetical protein
MLISASEELTDEERAKKHEREKERDRMRQEYYFSVKEEGKGLLPFNFSVG